MTKLTSARASLTLIVALAWPVTTPAQPVAASAPSEAAGTPVIAAPAGRLAGSQEGDLLVFKGIPYAAAPVGDLRWREPRELPAWEGTRPARSFGAACIQKPGLSAVNGGEPGPLAEDCLFLNIWAPRGAAPGSLPVLVWMHGGALIFGAGNLPVYDGSALARRGAVVVSLNYRLGALGYFSHPALGNTKPGSDANFGLLDQIAALRWLQKNIAAFGGDAASVTIFGQSAGAESVLALYAAPLARGLFARGIAQSPYGIPGHPLAKAAATGTKVGEALGVPASSATARALRAVPAEAFGRLEGAGLSLAPSFVIGDRALPASILETFQSGGEHRLPLVIGGTSDDSSVATGFGVDPAGLVRQMGAARIAVKPLYPAGTADAELGRMVVRDVLFTTFAKRIAWLHAPRAPTWRYYFDYVPPGLRATQPGAPHGGDIAWIFGTADNCDCTGGPLAAVDRRVMKRMGDYWSGFAANARPEAPGLPAWPRDTRTAPKVMVFDAEGGAAASGDFMKARLNAFTVMLNLLDRLGPAR